MNINTHMQQENYDEPTKYELESINNSLDALLAFRNGDKNLKNSDRIKVLEAALAACVEIMGDTHPEEYNRCFSDAEQHELSFLWRPFCDEEVSHLLKYALFGSKVKKD